MPTPPPQVSHTAKTSHAIPQQRLNFQTDDKPNMIISKNELARTRYEDSPALVVLLFRFLPWSRVLARSPMTVSCPRMH